MPYTIEWIVKNRIILVRNSGELTESEIHELSEEMKQMYAQGVAPVHALEDDRAFKGLSKVTFEIVRSFFDAAETVDFSKVGWIIAIVPEDIKEIADFLGKVGEVVAQTKYKRVQTVSQALDFLAKHDATLPDQSEWSIP